MSDEHLQDDPNSDQDDAQDQNDGLEGDELKTKLAEDLGLDPEDESQAEILEKAFQRETKQRRLTAKAIQQKQKYRTELEGFKQKGDKPKVNDQPKGDEEDFDKRVEKTALRILEQRELKTLNLGEDLEEEVKKLAELRNIPVIEAAKDPYIQFRKQEIEREARIKAATPSGKSKGKTVNLDPSKPPNRSNYTPDEEGSKAYRQDMEAYQQRQKDKSQLLNSYG